MRAWPGPPHSRSPTRPLKPLLHHLPQDHCGHCGVRLQAVSADGAAAQAGGCRPAPEVSDTEAGMSSRSSPLVDAIPGARLGGTQQLACRCPGCGHVGPPCPAPQGPVLTVLTLFPPFCGSRTSRFRAKGGTPTRTSRSSDRHDSAASRQGSTPGGHGSARSGMVQEHRSCPAAAACPEATLRLLAQQGTTLS